VKHTQDTHTCPWGGGVNKKQGWGWGRTAIREARRLVSASTDWRRATNEVVVGDEAPARGVKTNGVTHTHTQLAQQPCTNTSGCG
jgi:hypothetical protein